MPIRPMNRKVPMPDSFAGILNPSMLSAPNSAAEIKTPA